MRSSSAASEHGRHLGVGREQSAQRHLVVPGGEGVSLHELVCALAADPGLDQPQERAAREHQAVGRLEVSQHPLGIDGEPLDEPAGAVEHVVERDRGVGQHHPLGRRVRDVALVPQRDVLETDVGVRAQHPGEPADALAHDRVALVRHRRAALLPGRERLERLAHLGALQVPDLEREPLERRARAGHRREQRRVPVAGHDLGGDVLAVETERGERGRLHARIGVRVRPDGARELPDPHAVEGRLQADTLAAHLGHPPEQLQAEGGRLGVDAVGAADDGRVPELLGADGRGRLDGIALPRAAARRRRGAAARGPCRRRPTR